MRALETDERFRRGANLDGAPQGAAIAHLAHSTPEEFRFTSTDFNSYVTVSTADGAPQRSNGFMSASTKPGLGIEPKFSVLGKRIVEVF